MYVLSAGVLFTHLSFCYATLGFLGEGPDRGGLRRKQALPLEARPAVRLDQGRPVGPLTRAKRDAAIVDSRHWLNESVGVYFEEFLGREPHEVNQMLVGYGQDKYDTVTPRALLLTRCWHFATLRRSSGVRCLGRGN